MIRFDFICTLKEQKCTLLMPTSTLPPQFCIFIFECACVSRWAVLCTSADLEYNESLLSNCFQLNSVWPRLHPLASTRHFPLHHFIFLFCFVLCVCFLSDDYLLTLEMFVCKNPYRLTVLEISQISLYGINNHVMFRPINIGATRFLRLPEWP